MAEPVTTALTAVGKSAATPAVNALARRFQNYKAVSVGFEFTREFRNLAGKITLPAAGLPRRLRKGEYAMDKADHAVTPLTPDKLRLRSDRPLFDAVTIKVTHTGTAQGMVVLEPPRLLVVGKPFPLTPITVLLDKQPVAPDKMKYVLSPHEAVEFVYSLSDLRDTVQLGHTDAVFSLRRKLKKPRSILNFTLQVQGRKRGIRWGEQWRLPFEQEALFYTRPEYLPYMQLAAKLQSVLHRAYANSTQPQGCRPPTMDDESMLLRHFVQVLACKLQVEAELDPQLKLTRQANLAGWQQGWAQSQSVLTSIYPELNWWVTLSSAVQLSDSDYGVLQEVYAELPTSARI